MPGPWHAGDAPNLSRRTDLVPESWWHSAHGHEGGDAVASAAQDSWVRGRMGSGAADTGCHQLGQLPAVPPGEASPRGPGAERRGAEAGQLSSLP